MVRCTSCHATFQLTGEGAVVPAGWDAEEGDVPTLEPVALLPRLSPVVP